MPILGTAVTRRRKCLQSGELKEMHKPETAAKRVKQLDDLSAKGRSFDFISSDRCRGEAMELRP
jgi:hypothetical protein